MTTRKVTARDGTIAEVKQHKRNLFSLTITSRHTGHNRWGTRAEIEEDEKVFIETGRLPVSGPRW